MFRLLWTATVTILAATLCDGAFIPKDLACPQGGYITRETFCEDSPGCPNGEDSDTIHPRGPCIVLGKLVAFSFRICCLNLSSLGDCYIFYTSSLKLEIILRSMVSHAVPTERSFH